MNTTDKVSKPTGEASQTALRRLTLAAGPGGPASCAPVRERQVRDTTTAIRDSCDELIRENRYPSMALVEQRSGLARSTVTSKCYKHLLIAGRTRFRRVQEGMTLEAASELEAVEGEEIERAGGAGTDVVAEPLPAESPPLDWADRERTYLERLARLEVEVARRDGQLYHALDLIRRWRTTLRWHRTKFQELTLMLEAMGAEPMTERKPRQWSEDMVAEWFEDDPDNNDSDAE